jgi:hypothetical protein
MTVIPEPLETGGSPMVISSENILRHGTLRTLAGTDDEYDHVFVTGCFRIFYTLSGPTSPGNLHDSNNDGIPDFIDNIACRFEAARILLTRSFGLRDPLQEGLFFEQGAKFIDVWLQEIPREHGIASDRVYETAPALLANTPFQGKSLRIKIHRNLIARTGTPLHEFFHLCQFAYAPLHNMWFMEGLARWSQSIIAADTGQQEKLPSTAAGVVDLLKKFHEAEFLAGEVPGL